MLRTQNQSESKHMRSKAARKEEKKKSKHTRSKGKSPTIGSDGERGLMVSATEVASLSAAGLHLLQGGACQRARRNCRRRGQVEVEAVVLGASSDTARRMSGSPAPGWGRVSAALAAAVAVDGIGNGNSRVVRRRPSVLARTKHRRASSSQRGRGPRACGQRRVAKLNGDTDPGGTTASSGTTWRRYCRRQSSCASRVAVPASSDGSTTVAARSGRGGTGSVLAPPVPWVSCQYLGCPAGPPGELEEAPPRAAPPVGRATAHTTAASLWLFTTFDDIMEQVAAVAFVLRVENNRLRARRQIYYRGRWIRSRRHRIRPQRHRGAWSRSVTSLLTNERHGSNTAADPARSRVLRRELSLLGRRARGSFATPHRRF